MCDAITQSGSYEKERAIVNGWEVICSLSYNIYFCILDYKNQDFFTIF